MNSMYPMGPTIRSPFEAKPIQGFDNGCKLPCVIAAMWGADKEWAFSNYDRSAKFNKRLVAMALENDYSPSRSRVFPDRL